MLWNLLIWGAFLVVVNELHLRVMRPFILRTLQRRRDLLTKRRIEALQKSGEAFNVAGRVWRYVVRVDKDSVEPKYDLVEIKQTFKSPHYVPTVNAEVPGVMLNSAIRDEKLSFDLMSKKFFDGQIKKQQMDKLRSAITSLKLSQGKLNEPEGQKTKAARPVAKRASRGSSKAGQDKATPSSKTKT